MIEQAEKITREKLLAAIKEKYPQTSTAELENRIAAVADKIFETYPISQALKPDPDCPEKMKIDGAELVRLLGIMRVALVWAVVDSCFAKAENVVLLEEIQAASAKG